MIFKYILEDSFFKLIYFLLKMYFSSAPNYSFKLLVEPKLLQSLIAEHCTGKWTCGYNGLGWKQAMNGYYVLYLSGLCDGFKLSPRTTSLESYSIGPLGTRDVSCFKCKTSARVASLLLLMNSCDKT